MSGIMSISGRVVPGLFQQLCGVPDGIQRSVKLAANGGQHEAVAVVLLQFLEPETWIQARIHTRGGVVHDRRPLGGVVAVAAARSEERRVGKECRCGWGWY